MNANDLARQSFTRLKAMVSPNESTFPTKEDLARLKTLSSKLPIAAKPSDFATEKQLAQKLQNQLDSRSKLEQFVKHYWHPYNEAEQTVQEEAEAC